LKSTSKPANRQLSQGDGVLVLVQLQDVIDSPEVSEDADGRFTVLAIGLDDAEVANAVG
jgi:hypothetical protein